MSENPIQDAPSREMSGYVTWNNDAEFQQALAKMSDGMDVIQPMKAQGFSSSRTFQNIDTNVSVRDGFTRLDYEYYRPDEAVPRSPKAAIAACMNAYTRIGLLHDVIDSMADFASQGIRIVHSDPRTQRWYKNWFKKSRGKNRSERFLNMLYKAGNVVIRRVTSTIDVKDFNEIQKGLAAADVPYPKSIEPSPMEIPIRYIIHNPTRISVISDEIDLLAGNIRYGYAMTATARVFNNNLYDTQKRNKERLKNLPEDIREALQTGRISPLDPDKTVSYFYKKDDDMLWALPLSYSILDDLILLRKLKLADTAALDGAISRIRLWKLGDMDNKIMPTEAAISKLANILMDTSGNGNVLDLIWNPAIELVETSTDVYRFLGSEKYTPTLTNIYAGLGIPLSLTGLGGGGGMTTSFMAIKKFIERLQYGRDQLNEFWENEIKLIRKAFRHRPDFSQEPPQVIYDHMTLTDEYSMMKLLIDLADRDIISNESLREEFGYLQDVEESRLSRETGSRRKQPKVSPYHDADPNLSKEKMFIQRGAVTPSEVGIQLDERSPDEKSGMEMQFDATQQKIKDQQNKGTPGQGRPKNSKDAKKRKQRIPLTASELQWARGAQDRISKLILPFFLNKYDKTNVRQFTDIEFNEYENFKFGVLTNIEPFGNLDDESIIQSIKKPFNNFPNVKKIFGSLMSKSAAVQIDISIDDRRLMQRMAYLAIWSDEND